MHTNGVCLILLEIKRYTCIESYKVFYLFSFENVTFHTDEFTQLSFTNDDDAA